MGNAGALIDSRELSATIALGLLLLSRILPLAWLLPSAAPRAVPGLAASMLSIALGLVMLPLALASTHPTLALDATLLPRIAVELVRGTLLGLAVALPLHAFGWAGELVDLTRAAPGVALDTLADGGLPAAQLYRYAALALCFASGSHLLVIDTFADTLQGAPLGSLPSRGSPLPELVHSLASIVTAALSLSLQLAAPVLLGGLVVVLALGLLARVSAVLVSPLAQGPLLPVLGLGLLCVSASLVLPQAPLTIEVFVKHAERILRELG